MKLENEKVILSSLNLNQLRLSGAIHSLMDKRLFPLAPMDIEILELLSRQFSITEVVQFFLKKGALVSFDSLKKLLYFLTQEKLISNPSFHSYFLQTESAATSLSDEFLDNFLAKVTNLFGDKEAAEIRVDLELKEIPFFRSLDPAIFALFLQQMKVIETPAKTKICEQNQLQRSLFVLLRGQASIFVKDIIGQSKKIAVLSAGSVFGEIGFFLGAPRSADIVTDRESLILRFPYVAEVFDGLIKRDKAQLIQKRFWLIHALLKSSVFKELPNDCFDALISAGTLKTIGASSIVIREGELGRFCYIVVQGSLKVSQSGKEIRKLSQGDCFGEVALLLSQGLRTATVTSETETILLEIGYDQFYRLMSENLFLAAEFEKFSLSRIRDDQQRKK